MLRLALRAFKIATIAAITRVVEVEVVIPLLKINPLPSLGTIDRMCYACTKIELMINLYKKYFICSSL